MKKKLFGAALTILLLGTTFFGVAQAEYHTRIYNLYLATTVSGNTTVASGTSNMILEGEGILRSQGLFTIPQIGYSKGDTYVIQLDNVTAAPATGDASGATMTIRFRESIYDTANHWAASGTSNLLDGIPVSSAATRQQKEFTATGLGNMRIEFVSGITPFSAVTAQLVIYSEF